MLLARVDPWTGDEIVAFAATVENALDQLPKPTGFESLLPAGDPWLESWKDGDPLRHLTVAILRETSERPQQDRVTALVVLP